MAAFKLGVVLARWSQQGPPAHPRAWYQDFFTNPGMPGVAAYWFRQSDGQLVFEGRVFDWFDLQATAVELQMPGNPTIGRQPFANRALIQAVKKGFDPAGLDAFVVVPDVVPPAGWVLDAGAMGLDATVDALGGAVRVTSPCAVIPVGSDFDFACHELGHVIGLDHSFGLPTFAATGALPGEYGHPYCIMSAQTYGSANSQHDIGTAGLDRELQTKGPGLNGATRLERGWLVGQEVELEPGLNTIFTLHSLGAPWGDGFAKVLRMRDLGGRTYTVELRSPADEDDRGMVCPALVINALKGSTADTTHPGTASATYLGEIQNPDHYPFVAPGFVVELVAVGDNQRSGLVRIIEALRPWNAWVQLHPETVFNQQTPVAAVAREPGQLDLFKVGFDGRVWSSWWHEGSPGWAGWFQIHPETMFAQQAPVTALGRRPDQLDLFVTGLDGAVWSSFWHADPAGWRPWFPIHPETVFRQDRPVVALARQPEHLDLFRVGFDGAVWSTFWQPDPQGWRPWFQIHPETRFPLEARVTALARQPDHLDLYVVGHDGAVWSSWWHADGGGWRPWFQLHPETVFRFDQEIVPVGRTADHIDLFVVGHDGAVWSSWWDAAGGGWRPWFQIHPETRFDPDSRVAALARRQDHLDLFVTGRDGAVWSCWWHADAAQWRPWFPIQPETVFTRAHPATALARRPEQIDLYKVGFDGAVWSSWWPGGWTQRLPPRRRIPIYAVGRDGVLNWYRHDGRETSHRQWSGPKEVGRGWQGFRQVVAGAGGALYAIRGDGVMLWYHHDGREDGSFRWRGPSQVGTGWHGFTHVFADEEGAVYGIQPDGKLLWYRHDGREDGSTRWAGSREVGTGWSGFRSVLAGGGGVIYAITQEGKLLWYRHDGRADGTSAWSGPHEVGTGWHGARRVVADRAGLLYAVQPDGGLLWYRHDGHGDGSFRWSGPKQIGNGWGGFQDLLCG